MDKEIIEAAAALGRLLKVAGMTVSTAESCTGGGIAAAMTEIPGSSDWFMGGFVTYANEWKSARLGVRETTLAEHGAVSSQTVSEMLEGLLECGGTDLGVAVSGIAGPGGGVPGKPVGTVFIGVAGREWQDVRRFNFDGDRAGVRRKTVLKALEMLREHI